MKILITGSTGFIGNHVINQLLHSNFEIIAMVRDAENTEVKPWFSKVTLVKHTIGNDQEKNLFKKFNNPNICIHLAWGGLDNFKSDKHIYEELPKHQAFLSNLIQNGLKSLTCVGTCIEYGMKEGELFETMESTPVFAYPIAKNQLRINIEKLQNKHTFDFKWLRLFYMFGKGQNPKSILIQLQKALDNNEETFNMSQGDQLRDYLPVEEVAEKIIKMALKHNINGIFNCSSGQPISVKQLVENYLVTDNKKIKLNLGFYPYPDYEPKQFWGNAEKINKLNLNIKMNPIEQFKKDKELLIDSYANNKELKQAAEQFNIISNKEKYSYNFSWMGRPIIQYPQDMVMMQELIWDIKPDLIVETGIAHGGSLIYYASIMELIGKGEVLGIDIDIREHNKKEIEAHPMSKRIKMIQGSAIDKNIVDQVAKHVEGKKTVMVCLDSNHTHDHVLEELKLYAQFTSVGSYCVVFDTIVEDMPKGMYDRNWDVGNNPKTAVFEFLKTNSNFKIDKSIDNKLLISVAPDGYLKRVQ